MTSTLLKYNVILIVLCIGMTLIHNSSGEKVKKEINLYYDPISPPCRAVLLTLEALNLEFKLIYKSLIAKRQLERDFLEINSLHTLPVMQDGDFVLTESNAIIVYLIQVYGGEDGRLLYPNDPKIQAQVNQRLHFDNGTLYWAFRFYYNPWIYYRIPIAEEGKKKIKEALEFLENVLEKSTWTAGKLMTVADITLVASITTFKVAGIDLNKYDNINKWLIRCANSMVGYDKANQEGIIVTEKMLKKLDEKFENEAQTPSPQF